MCWTPGRRLHNNSHSVSTVPFSANWPGTQRLNMLHRALIIAAAITASLPGQAHAADCQDGEIRIRFSHVTNTEKNPKGIAAELLKQRVNREMDGKACMEVFPNSELYDDNDVLEALLQGDVQLAAPSLSKFETFTKAFRLFDLPFVFKDIAAVDRYQASPEGKALLDSMQRKGLQGLAYWHNGMKQFSADRPLLSPADFKGLKFRIQPSTVLDAQFRALGATPQRMAFSEAYDALARNIINGQENTWSNIYSQRFHDVQDGFTESNHGIIDYLVVTSTNWWSSLPADTRAQFSDILRDVTVESNAASTAINQETRQLIIQSGSPVRALTISQRAAWVEAMKPVWRQFENDIGRDTIAQITDLSEP